MNTTTTHMIESLRAMGYKLTTRGTAKVERAEEDFLEALDNLSHVLARMAEDYKKDAWQTASGLTRTIGKSRDDLSLKASEITLALTKLVTVIETTAVKIDMEG